MSNTDDTILLVHDTLPGNGLSPSHPFLHETVLSFSVDALTYPSPPVRNTGAHDPAYPRNQWFLVVETENQQACLSLQPYGNARTGGIGILVLQLMENPIYTTADLLYRQTYMCKSERLTGRDFLNVALAHGWHKFELVNRRASGLFGRRFHMKAMLNDLQDTNWIGAKSDQGLDVEDYLPREYEIRYRQGEVPRLITGILDIREGRFRLDMATGLI